MQPQEIMQQLEAMHPNAACQLDYKTPYQLLVAVILSAQCTDKRVNEVTPKLFAWCDTPEAMAQKSVEELIPYIHSCGFYRNKAVAIIEASKEIVARYGGEVPRTQEELMTLRGVGRKTANVVYNVAYQGNAIPVDTHVFRLSHRLGLSEGKDPEAVERDLMGLYPEEDWGRLHHLLIWHGRYICTAKKPNCAECSIAACPSRITKE